MGVRQVTVTIPNGTAVSEGFALQLKEHVIAVRTPSSWTAADIGLDGSDDNSTFFQIADGTTTTVFYRLCKNVPTGGIAYNTQVQNTQIFPAGFAFMRLHSLNTGSTADVTQGADRSCVVYISNDEL